MSKHTDFGPYVGLGSGAPTADITYSNFADLSYVASKTTMTGTLADGNYWYNATVAKANIDLLEHNGSAWVLSKRSKWNVSEPVHNQSDGTALVAGDVWLDSDDTENSIHKWSGTVRVAIDGSDPTYSRRYCFCRP